MSILLLIISVHVRKLETMSIHEMNFNPFPLMKVLTDFHLTNKIPRALYNFDFWFTSMANNGGQYI